MTIEEQFDNIVKVGSKIKVNEITILTGDNGSGKSLIRQAILSFISKQLDPLETDMRKLSRQIGSISMQKRTQGNKEYMELRAFFTDQEDEPTSLNTIFFIEALMDYNFKEDKKDKFKFIIIDEPELGCSEETQLALSYYFNENLHKLNCGVLIITHSRIIVENVFHDNFLNLSGYKDKEEWLNRTIIATDIEKAKTNSNDLRSFVYQQLKNKT